MPTYTVHQPPQREGRPVPGPERFVFVRDGFYVWAFLLPPLWMLLHRLWLVLLGYVVVVAVMAVAFAVADIPQWADAIASLLFGILIGLEAATLRRWSLRKWTQLGYVVAEDEELAERRFFAQWVGGNAQAVPPPSAPPPSSSSTSSSLPVIPAPLPRRAPPDVIGLFPQPGMPR
jgi:hypothetical protein